MRRALLILAVIVISVLVYFSLSGKVSESVITDENYAYKVERWLSPGWNMGSQLDAVKDCYAYEKAWRGYLCGQGFFDTVAAAGIKTIRIPVTWIGNIGPAPEYRLDSARLARVREVIGWAHNVGLNVIINLHHDGSTSRDCRWIDINKAFDSDVSNAQIQEQLAAVWTQIAEAFRNEGQYLIFEPFNEISYPQEYKNKADDPRTYDIINGWNQVFVDAVRATGGQNASRYLSVVGYGPTIEKVTKYLVMPKDTVKDRLLVSVHFYAPKDFTLDAKENEWGHTRSVRLGEKSYTEAYVIRQLDMLQSRFVDKGIPVYIGEMGCVYRDNPVGERYRKYYLEYVCKTAADRGIACFIWDNAKPVPGTECHAYFRHDTGEYMFDGREMVETVVRAVSDSSRTYTLESIYNKAPDGGDMDALTVKQ